MGCFDIETDYGFQSEVNSQAGACVQVSASPVCDIPGKRIDWLTDSQGRDVLTKDGQIIILK